MRDVERNYFHFQSFIPTTIDKINVHGIIFSVFAYYLFFKWYARKKRVEVAVGRGHCEYLIDYQSHSAKPDCNFPS